MDLFKYFRKDAAENNLDIKQIPLQNSPVLAYTKSNWGGKVKRTQLTKGEAYFEPPEYDLVEVGRAEDVESYVMMGNIRKSGLMFKAGWTWRGKDPERIKYLKKRQMQIERAQGKSFFALFDQLGRDIVRYSNSYLVKVRNTEHSGGKVREVNGKTVKPVAAYFHMMPETVKAIRDENGTPLKFRQLLPAGKYRDFNPSEVIHFTFNRKGGFFCGTPILIPVLDDIRALRKIEENIETLIYQHSFPLFQYKIGTDTIRPEVLEDGTTEIELAKVEIQNMPTEGGIVTPGHHELIMIGAEGRALRVEGYVEHFKKRIIAGLGMSQVDFGDGSLSNRSTSDNMSRALVDLMKYYQMIIADQIQTEIVNELLLESDFSGNPLESDLVVRFEFNEIDTDSRIKVENHGAMMFSSHAITETEMREKYFGLEPIRPEDRDEMYFELIEKPMAAIKTVDTPVTKEAETNSSTATGGKSKTVKTETNDPAGKTAAMMKIKQQPANQHGQNLGPTKAKSSFEGETYKDSVSYGFREAVQEALDRIEKDPTNLVYARQLLFVLADRTKVSTRKEMQQTIMKGYASVGAGHLTAEHQNVLDHMTVRLDRDIDRLFTRAARLIDIVVAKEQVANRVATARTAFDSIAYRSSFIDVTDYQKAYNLGRYLGLKKVGKVQCKTQGHSDCEICKTEQTFDLNAITFDMLPPFHPNCYSEDTEVLTESGFKLIKDVRKGERVLALNPETKDLEYVSVKNTIVGPITETLIRFKNRSFDLGVTKDHNMVFQKTWDLKKGRDKIYFAKLSKLPKEVAFYRSSKWTGEDRETIEIGSRIIPTEIYCKLMGYYLSEGNVTKHSENSYEVMISQWKFLDEMFEDLIGLPVNVHKQKGKVDFYDVEIGRYLAQFGKSYEKFIPKELMNLSPKYLRIFLDAFNLGDGSRVKGKIWKGHQFTDRKIYFTSSVKMADQLGELILKIGKRPSYHKQLGKGKPVKHNNGTYIGNWDMWIVAECNASYTPRYNLEEEEIEYNRPVYCVELEKYHTLYVRVNGKCTWCGNCSCQIVPVEN